MRPSFLKPGDVIGICAPARKVSRDELEEGIAHLKSWGYRVLEAPNLYGSYHQFSGTDDERAADMQYLINHADVKAIISARGGYGCMRIIDKLDFDALKTNPKWMIGFSDMTVFHSHLLKHFDLQSIHGPMLFNFSKDRYEETSLMRLQELLSGNMQGFEIESDPLTAMYNRKGNSAGILCGGNLSLLYALSGSASDIDTEGKILFLEDLDEYLYHVDRMMMQLLRCGKLSKLKGLIVGGMNDMRDNIVPFGEIAEEIISRIVKPFDYPVWFGFPAGHIHVNQPLIMGAEVTMVVEEKLTLEYRYASTSDGSNR